MEPTVIIRGRVVNGKKVYYNDKLVESQNASLEGQEFEEVTKLKQEEHSDDQFGYYFAGVIRNGCMKSEIFGGWSEKDVHDFFKSQFLTFTKAKIVNGETVEIVVQESLSGIGKRKMAKFMKDVEVFCAEHDITIPEPGDIKPNKYKTSRDGKKSKHMFDKIKF